MEKCTWNTLKKGMKPWARRNSVWIELACVITGTLVAMSSLVAIIFLLSHGNLIAWWAFITTALTGIYSAVRVTLGQICDLGRRFQ